MRRMRSVAILLVSVVLALPSVITGAPAPIGADVTQLTFRVGETFGWAALTGVDVQISAPDTIGITTDPSTGARVFICLKAGESAIVLEGKSGAKHSFLIECLPGLPEFAPSPGGTADEPRRFSTGNNTKVTKVDCGNPLSCDIANRGREGGFVARCVGRGPGEGGYTYEPLIDKPDKPTPTAKGKLRARCPRD